MKLFSVLGIDIKLHFTWWFVFILLAWSLSTSFFPGFYPELGAITHWLMGVTASLLLFVSVLLHELSHSLVARAKKIKVESITLFFFGGVAAITDEEMKPTDEFQMALVGPIFSLFLGGIFYAIFYYNGSLFLKGIMFYLYQLNLILAVFNLVPGYPLDGGRALRAVLYAYFKDLRKATYIAAKGGKFFAGILFFLGFLSLIAGTGMGLWFIFLGGFLYLIAGASYDQVLIREALSKIPLENLIEKKFVKVSPDLTFPKFLKKYYACGQEAFVVQKGKKFLGILNLRKTKKMSHPLQEKTFVRQLLIPASKIKPLDHSANGYQAFKFLMEQDLEMLPVVKGNSWAGIISRKTLMHYLSLESKYGFFPDKKNIRETIRKFRMKGKKNHVR